MRRTLILSLLIAGVAAPSLQMAQANPFARPAVSEAELDESRGGFSIGGIEVAIAVQSDTRINGALVLRTVWAAVTSTPELSVFGRTDPNAPAVTGGGPTVTTANGSTVTFTTSQTDFGEVPTGLSKLDVTRGGPAVDTLAGKVSVASAGVGTQVILAATEMEIRHLVGQAYGTSVANTANNVSIDNATNINIDLSNLPPLSIGSTWFRLDGLAIDSATRLGR
ncbi:MAG: hypothetical protein ACXWUR_07180 [Allosphingosinicella sp.]